VTNAPTTFIQSGKCQPATITSTRVSSRRTCPTQTIAKIVPATRNPRFLDFIIYFYSLICLCLIPGSLRIIISEPKGERKHSKKQSFRSHDSFQAWFWIKHSFGEKSLIVTILPVLETVTLSPCGMVSIRKQHSVDQSSNEVSPSYLIADLHSRGVIYQKKLSCVKFPAQPLRI